MKYFCYSGVLLCMYMYVEKNESTLYVLQLSQKLELDWKMVTDICLFQFKPLLKGHPF